MGLDQTIFRISKSHWDETKVYEVRDIAATSLVYEKDSPKRYRQLDSYTQELQVNIYTYDMDKIKADYRLSDDCFVRAFSPNGILIVDRLLQKSVKIATETLKDRYTLCAVKPSMVCNCKEVCSWRKRYDIQEWFCRNLPEEVENMGYYIISSDVQREFNEAFPEEHLYVEEPSEDSALFYWEWY